MDWDHRDLDNLNLDENSSTTLSSAKSSPIDGLINISGIFVFQNEGFQINPVSMSQHGNNILFI